MTTRCTGPRGISLRILAVVASVCGCTRYYKTPAVPPNQLAVIERDDRVTEVSVDGLPVRILNSKRSSQFYVAAGCRQLVAKFEQSYFVYGARKAAKKGLTLPGAPVVNLAVELGNSEDHDYETHKPIRFYVPTSPGRMYWLTASFDGDRFVPRVVELDETGQAARKFAPDKPCTDQAAAPGIAAAGGAS